MSEVSVKDQIKKLVDLQKIDKEIYEHKTDLKEKPEEIALVKEEFERKKNKLHVLEDQLKAKQMERKEKEVDLQAKEEIIAKSNGQLSQLKTNKEYKAKLTEMEGQKADKSIIEEKILILFDEVDAINSKIQKEKEVLVQEEKNYLAQKKTVEQMVVELEEKIKILDHKRRQITADINPESLARYERILAGKEGLAMVPVLNGSCSGCYMNVPAQKVNEIKKHDQLIYCEVCARILYIEEEL
ncbi:MAG: C4-type zinc ribbon domain-containing protein [Candidatus Omnitrophica bacterium]|nr:C4-type zinc ribbon domain-containing protein [Candidatus Omnitrophota bacterium]